MIKDIWFTIFHTVVPRGTATTTRAGKFLSKKKYFSWGTLAFGLGFRAFFNAGITRASGTTILHPQLTIMLLCIQVSIEFSLLDGLWVYEDNVIQPTYGFHTSSNFDDITCSWNHWHYVVPFPWKKKPVQVEEHI